MRAEQSLQEGHLQETLTQLQQQIRQDPAKTELRVFLFQLLAVTGQWERALNQLNVAGEMDASTLPMVQTYREALRCELLRVEVFAGKRSPLVFGDPEQWLALMIQALPLMAEGEYGKAAELRGRALDDAPATSGRINEHSFEWLMDPDPRFGPILEAIVNGHYYWIPFHRIRRIELEPPADLRDLVWLPATFTWANGGQTVGLIPVRYPGSDQSMDDAIRMARKTDWRTMDDVTQLGIGQRILATDADDYALLDLRTIEFNAIESAAVEGGDG